MTRVSPEDHPLSQIRENQMFKIYGLHTPMFIKPVLAAEEMGANYEVVKVDLMKGETKTAAHLARHPFGKMPALEHNGKFLFESNAIMKYMASVTESALYPKDLYARAVGRSMGRLFLYACWSVVHRDLVPELHRPKIL